MDLSPDATPFDIADKLLVLKMQEADLTARRIAAEEQLIAALEFTKPSGSKTYTLKDEEGCKLKVTLKQPLSCKIDADEWPEVAKGIPFELRPVKEVYSPIAKGVTLLRKEHPALFLQFCQAYSETPGKIGVTFPE